MHAESNISVEYLSSDTLLILCQSSYLWGSMVFLNSYLYLWGMGVDVRGQWLGKMYVLFSQWVYIHVCVISVSFLVYLHDICEMRVNVRGQRKCKLL